MVSVAEEFMVQEQHELNMRLHHEYYSRIKGGHGVRDLIGADTSLKDSRINTVCDDSDLLCPIVVMVV